MDATFAKAGRDLISDVEVRAAAGNLEPELLAVGFHGGVERRLRRRKIEHRFPRVRATQGAYYKNF